MSDRDIQDVIYLYHGLDLAMSQHHVSVGEMEPDQVSDKIEVSRFDTYFFDRSCSGQPRLVLMDVDGDVCGLCWLHHDVLYAYIHSFYVSEHRRGCGLGTQLMRYVLSNISDKAYVHLGVLCSNTRAQALYKRLGFYESNIEMKRKPISENKDI